MGKINLGGIKVLSSTLILACSLTLLMIARISCLRIYCTSVSISKKIKTMQKESYKRRNIHTVEDYDTFWKDEFGKGVVSRKNLSINVIILVLAIGLYNF